MWTGLGYYSRGARILEAAKLLMYQYEGKFPRTAAELETFLPGVGPYTAGTNCINQKNYAYRPNIVRSI